MKKYIKCVTYSFFILIVALTFFSATPAHAQVPFGGLNIAQYPCTCSGSVIIWSYFAPLYNPSLPTVGALTYTYGTQLFLHYILHPGAWALGFYTPGAGACLIIAYPTCYPLFTLGAITPFVGTSL